MKGILPIHVLIDGIISYFENVGWMSLETCSEWVEKGLINSKILYSCSQSLIRTPYTIVDAKQIVINQSFCAYIWSFCYSLISIIDESIRTSRIVFGNYRKIDLDNPIINRSITLLEWAKSLSCEFSPWPLKLPSPEKYDAPISLIDMEQYYVHRANSLFFNALCFCILHECSHLVNGHSQYIESSRRNEQFTDEEIVILKEIEIDADNFALDVLIGKNPSESHIYNIAYSCVCSISSILLLKRQCSDISSKSHPDLDVRIVNIMNKFDIENTNDLLAVKSIPLFCFILFERGINCNYFPDTSRQIDELIDTLLYSFCRYKPSAIS